MCDLLGYCTQFNLKIWGLCFDTVLEPTKQNCNLPWYCTQTNLKKVLYAVILLTQTNLKKCAICCHISFTTTWIHLLWYCNWTNLKKYAIFRNTVLESIWNNVQSAVILHSKPTWKNVQSAVILYLNQLEQNCNLLWYCTRTNLNKIEICFDTVLEPSERMCNQPWYYILKKLHQIFKKWP